MKCGDSRKLMMKRLDDKLNTEEARLLTEHLNICGECRTISHGFGEMEKLFAAEPLDLPPPEIEQAVMAKIREIDPDFIRKKAETKNGNFMVFWSLTAFTLIVLLGLSQRSMFGLSFPAYLGRWAGSLSGIANGIQIFLEIISAIFSGLVQGLSRLFTLIVWTGTACALLLATRSMIKMIRTREMPPLS